MFINESGNEEANRAVETLVNYATENPSLGLTINLSQVGGNQSEPKEFLNECKYFQLFSKYNIETECGCNKFHV